MKKIGIITHYYNNLNYGGNLQAYATCKILESLKVGAEQISFDFSNLTYLSKSGHSSISLNNRAGGFISKCKKKIKHLFFKLKIGSTHDIILKRKESFVNFQNHIVPHSQQCFNPSNILTCVGNYDIFITGSDQVWNLAWYNPAFFLDFVSLNKPKISYAASMPLTQLDEVQKETVGKHLKDFTAISVREKSSVDLIKDLSPVPVEHVLDPTLLLSVQEWNEVAVDYKIDGQYVFCCFLDTNLQARKIAKKFAKTHKLRLINIVFASGFIRYEDIVFGRKQLIKVGPEHFISLIKNAEYIFTDSFHAVVFSSIYKKQFFVFNRNKEAAMSERIVDITNIFNTQDRFCYGDRETYDYVNLLTDIAYPELNEKFEQLKQKSLDFLKRNLK